jgi:hypothetical protein
LVEGMRVSSVKLTDSMRKRLPVGTLYNGMGLSMRTVKYSKRYIPFTAMTMLVAEEKISTLLHEFMTKLFVICSRI